MATLIAVLKLLPMILAAVQAVEAAVPLPGTGKAKLDLIVGTVNDVYGTEQTLQKEIGKDQLAVLVQNTVQRVVACFNALGVFKKAAA